MFRSSHDKVWKAYAKKNKLPEPPKEWLDFQWATIGVLGRFSCPKEFAKDMFDEESDLGEILLCESEAIRN